MVKQVKQVMLISPWVTHPPKMFVDLLKQVDVNLTNYKRHIINRINTNYNQTSLNE